MALKDITLGQYFPGHSLIHRFDPRGKIIFTVIYIVAIFLCNSLLSYGVALAVLLILAAGGGAAVYFLVLKPKQGKKVPADLDDFDLEDEEEYLTEDEETEEKNE